MKIYLVGGAVRDMLLGKETASDRDWVVVGVTPEEMVQRGFVQVGADFPVFLHPETNEEYALARVERKVGVGYHGFSTETKDVTIQEDLMRRDLTINAIAFDQETMTFIDPAGGIKDLIGRKIRHCSDAFREDPLRVLRVARFKSKFPDFEVDTSTIAMCEQIVASGELNKVSMERFWVEFEKAAGNLKDFSNMMVKFGAFKHVDFFKQVFTEFDLKETLSLFDDFSIEKEATKEEILKLFFALAGNPETIGEVKGANSEVVQFCKDAENFGSVDALVHAKPWLDTSRSANLRLLYRIAGRDMQRYDVEMQMMKEVSSKDFPELSGKDLGEAIFKKRVEIFINN